MPSVVAIGDLDGDGVLDAAVSVRDPHPRLVVVVSGRSGETLHVLDGAGAAGGFGIALCAIGDVDGDAVPDLAVGAHHVPGGPLPTAEAIAERTFLERPWVGSVDVVSGRTGATLRRLVSHRRRDAFGTALAAGEDVDGDGRPDVVVGAGGQRSPAVGGSVADMVLGQVHVFDARSGEPGPRIVERLDGTLVRIEADGRERVLGGHEPPDLSSRFGTHVDLFPDVDGDGRRELLCGAPSFAPGTTSYVLLLAGGSLDVLACIEGPRGGAGSSFGESCEHVGDFDGDGAPDLGLVVDETGLDVRSWRGSGPLHRFDRAGHGYEGLGSSMGFVPRAEGAERGALFLAADDWASSSTGYLRLHALGDGRLLDAYEVEHEGGHAERGYGLDACTLGDVDGDGLTDFLIAVRAHEHVAVLSGASLDPVWSRTYAELTGEGEAR